MKRSILIGLAGLCALSLSAHKQNQVYLDYIAQWKAIAIQQEVDYGIPTAITLAQALLESNAGQSDLAREANNHFGIKCAEGWFGGVYYHDDDSKDECFRQYGRVAESYKDHSLFLQRPVYATCFEIAVEDYEGWAYRLKACGYATDQFYAQKLVRIIEEYRLDTIYIDGMSAPTVLNDTTASSNDVSAPVVRKRPLKAEVVHRNEPIMVIHNNPEPEYRVPLTAREERDSFLIAHPKRKCNGVNYVVAREEDTYANVAFRLNIRERDLREYNDALGRDMAKGDRIFLAPKKTIGDKPFVWTYPGLSFWQLCQTEGVQQEAIRKLNELDPTIRVFRTRQRIYLRKVKDDGDNR